MQKTPRKLRMHDMMTIDTIVFENLGGGAFKATPGFVNFLKYPGSNRVKVPKCCYTCTSVVDLSYPKILVPHTHTHTTIIKYVTCIKVKFIAQNIQITNNIHRNIQYIHSSTLLLSNTNSRLYVIN